MHQERSGPSSSPHSHLYLVPPPATPSPPPPPTEDEPLQEIEGKVHRRRDIQKALESSQKLKLPELPAPPQPPRRRWPLLVALIGGGLLVAAAILALLWTAGKTPAERPAPSLTFSAPSAQDVEVRVDGVVVDHTSFTIPLDDRSHLIELNEPGRAPMRFQVTAPPVAQDN